MRTGKPRRQHQRIAEVTKRTISVPREQRRRTGAGHRLRTQAVLGSGPLKRGRRTGKITGLKPRRALQK